MNWVFYTGKGKFHKTVILPDGNSMNWNVLGFGIIVWFYVFWKLDIFCNIIKMLATFLYLPVLFLPLCWYGSQ